MRGPVRRLIGGFPARAGLLVALAGAAALSSGAASPVHAQSRTRVAGGFGVASGFGDLADLTGVGAFGRVGVGFPRGDRFTFWLEGSAEGLPSDSDPRIEQGDWQYATRYLAIAEYRFTRPWSPWRLSGTLGAGATTFWDNSWYLFSTGDDGWPDYEVAGIVELSGTHLTAAPGFGAAYAIAPNLDVELLGRANLTFHGGEAFAFDTAGARFDVEPPGSPITSWNLSIGTRLRAGGVPSEWSDLEAGDRVRVWTAAGRQVEGRLVAAERGILRLHSGGELVELGFGELQSAAAHHTRADRGAIIGAASLGGLGALLGGLAAGVGCSVSEGDDCSDWVAGPVALGLTGAVTGFVLGSLLGGLGDGWSALPVP